MGPELNKKTTLQVLPKLATLFALRATQYPVLGNQLQGLSVAMADLATAYKSGKVEDIKAAKMSFIEASHSAIKTGKVKSDLIYNTMGEAFDMVLEAAHLPPRKHEDPIDPDTPQPDGEGARQLHHLIYNMPNA